MLPFALQVFALSKMPQFPSFCKSQLTPPAHNLVIPLPNYFYTFLQFCGNKGEYIWLLWWVGLVLPRREFDVTTTMLHICYVIYFTDFLVPPPQSRTDLGHTPLSILCTSHFPLLHHTTIFSQIDPQGGQGRHIWQIVRQSPMKTGWWDTSLTLQDLAMSNLHDIFSG